ncbi:hypothetical protein AQUCO_01300593v1 [Aquilegia coerulea]|uniref:AT-hook motif nuclear-localized protein n=1 Tax=Aquilegia coerulea TaxID=218851 RepID=A0A2G5E2J3_AQUCA|nr:hypothetical protein AQUCO_01300593v1 [Aquilegia coerulea]
MEGREVMSSGGITVMGADAPSNYHVAARSNENPNQIGGSTAVATSVSVAIGSGSGSGTSGIGGTTSLKKKRGRPRKYGPDGTVSLALSPMPISSSAPASSPVLQTSAAAAAAAPLTGEFSTEKRGRGRPAGSVNKQQQKVEVVENLGNWVSCSVGANFMPHVITVAAGEDVTMKIISFSQQGPRAICVLSANGVISNVTLRQPDSSGGTLTYEVVVGSFLPCTQQEQKPKKQKPESTSAAAPTAAVPISSAEMEEGYNGQAQRNSNTPKPNLTATASFRGENWAPVHSMQDSRNSATDINISLPEG